MPEEQRVIYINASWSDWLFRGVMQAIGFLAIVGIITLITLTLLTSGGRP